MVKGGLGRADARMVVPRGLLGTVSLGLLPPYFNYFQYLTSGSGSKSPTTLSLERPLSG
jgi:hypothetical protein